MDPSRSTIQQPSAVLADLHFGYNEHRDNCFRCSAGGHKKKGKRQMATLMKKLTNVQGKSDSTKKKSTG